MFQLAVGEGIPDIDLASRILLLRAVTRRVLHSSNNVNRTLRGRQYLPRPANASITSILQRPPRGRTARGPARRSSPGWDAGSERSGDRTNLALPHGALDDLARKGRLQEPWN